MAFIDTSVLQACRAILHTWGLDWDGNDGDCGVDDNTDDNRDVIYEDVYDGHVGDKGCNDDDD